MTRDWHTSDKSESAKETINLMKTTQDTGELRKYAMSGMAAFLPGMQYMVELMQRQLDEFRLQLAAMQGVEEKPRSNGHNNYGWAGMTAEERSAEMKRRQAKRKKKRSGWNGMTAEQRSVEMKRRKAMAAAKKAPPQTAPKHPREADHPDHAKWLAKLRRVQKKHWNSKTKAEKDALIAKMTAASKAKRLALAS